MFQTLLKKIVSWLREIWSLFKVIDDVIPKEHLRAIRNTSQLTQQSTSTYPRRNSLQTWSSQDNASSVARHRHIELEGYSESFRIDKRGRYDLNQLARFAENFVWVAPNEVDDFIADNIEHDIDYIDGTTVLWTEKSDCIEWAFIQYSALADLL